jgi:hypothetical protein
MAAQYLLSTKRQFVRMKLDGCVFDAQVAIKFLERGAGKASVLAFRSFFKPLICVAPLWHALSGFTSALCHPRGSCCMHVSNLGHSPLVRTLTD